MDIELQTCGKSWNLSGYNISVILISVFGHQGAATSLKMGRNCQQADTHIIVMMIFRFFLIFRHAYPLGGQIQKSILMKWSTLIHFMIWYKIEFTVYVNYEVEEEQDDMIFFQFLDILMPPGAKYTNQYYWNVVP